VIRTPVRAPNANARCERWISSARRGCLDWLLIVGRRHLEAVLAEYVEHYNGFSTAPSQPGAAAAAGTHPTLGRCRTSDPPDAGERADQRVLAAGRLTERTAGDPDHCLSACRHDLPGCRGGAIGTGWTTVADR